MCLIALFYALLLKKLERVLRLVKAATKYEFLSIRKLRLNKRLDGGVLPSTMRGFLAAYVILYSSLGQKTKRVLPLVAIQN